MKENTKKAAQESLNKVMQEANEPSVENLMVALNQANNRVKQMQVQMAQMVESYKDLQLRLATTEFQNRLDFLWKVMFTDNTRDMFGDDFIVKCAEEFKDMMFPQIPEELNNNEENA
jgi:Zn-dependent oligopeptidase